MARRPKPLNHETIVGLYADGVSMARMAKAMHVSPARIKAVLLANDIEPRVIHWGSQHHKWKGGRHTDVNGYVRITLSPDDPWRAVYPTGTVQEHRYVMAKELGRPLRPKETVHHIDGNKENNDLSNLQLMHTDHGPGIVFECNHCGSHDVRPVTF